VTSIVIHGGTVIDGSGGPAVRADVAIEGDRIVALAPDLGALDAARRVDASGLVVTPGFIDVHSHSDLTLAIDPRARSAIAQGVTLELVGNCGHGCAPLDRVERHADNIYGFDPAWPIPWRSFAEYLDALDTARPALNVAVLVAHGTLRLAAMREPGAPSTEAERQRMAALLDEALDVGAVGFSTGLEYPIEQRATAAEIARLCAAVAARGRLYASHTRNKDVHAVEAVGEAIDTAERAGVRLQVSHLLPRPGASADALERSMELIDRANARGMDVAFDIHTRRFGFTNLSVALPRWVVDSGPQGIAEVLRSRRSELTEHRSIIDSFGITGYEGVYIVDAPQTPEVTGRSVGDLAGRDRSPRDVILDVLAAHTDRIDGPMCIGWSYTVAQMARAVSHPRCSPASDATTLAPDGPLGGRVFHGAYTWAAWFLETMTGAGGPLSLAAAVHRLTGLPAERIGLGDRGAVRPGAYADLAVFDPAAVQARGTFEAPNLLATGMRHVIVNGVFALDDGAPTDGRGGRVLRA
jgi:N-acyl-D-amino-acid deacylase